VFSLPEAWVWDFWLVDDGTRYHLFFLYASKALRDPEKRHFRASVGHATSEDLVRWERVVDALVRSDAPAFDDLATWTGSVVRHPDGTWFMFYTGSSLEPAGNVQRIGFATSHDLYRWEKNPGNPVLEADPRWYEKLEDGQWHDEAFRDPWVYPDGGGWRMLITARANQGPADDRGVVGTAWSPDLRNWTLEPPLSPPGKGFGQMEVMQTADIDGSEFLLFSCVASDLSEVHRASGSPGGVWAVRRKDGPEPWDPAEARLVTDDEFYVGRVIPERKTGRAVFLAFHNVGPDGSFVGGVSDPRYAEVEDGRVVLREVNSEPFPAGDMERAS
jgi:beta-fructofuranosidase